jgi:hypothetical protein
MVSEAAALALAEGHKHTITGNTLSDSVRSRHRPSCPADYARRAGHEGTPSAGLSPASIMGPR